MDGSKCFETQYKTLFCHALTNKSGFQPFLGDLTDYTVTYLKALVLSSPPTEYESLLVREPHQILVTIVQTVVSVWVTRECISVFPAMNTLYLLDASRIIETA
jgi:hypothetical protein